jgi:hypothetical protein
VQARREAARKEHELARQGLQVDGLAGCERATRRQDGDDTLAADGLVREVRDDVGVERESHVDRASAQRGRHPVRAHLFGQQLDVRPAFLECLPECRQGLEPCAPVVRDLQAAELAGGRTLRCRNGRVGLRERTSRAVEQRRACVCQADLTAGAVEQA